MRFESGENIGHGEFLENAAFGMAHGGADKQKGYLGYQEGIRDVKENYEDDPTDPEKRIANDLHALVAEELGLKDYSDLKFYSAVGSALDVYHGVDGFFELGDKRVTVDVTMNPEKETTKADILLSADPDAEEAKKTVPMEELKRVAHDIAEKLREEEQKKAA